MSAGARTEQEAAATESTSVDKQVQDGLLVPLFYLLAPGERSRDSLLAPMIGRAVWSAWDGLRAARVGFWPHTDWPRYAAATRRGAGPVPAPEHPGRCGEEPGPERGREGEGTARLPGR